MSRAERRALVEREHPALPISQQCRLLAISRSAAYRRPAEVGEADLAIMALIDRQYLARPYYGSRRMAAWLATQGYVVNRKRVRRLMRLMGLVAIYQRPNTSKAAAEHKIYPYLLGGIAIERVNQVWCSDVTYIPMAKGFLYLVVVMDWVSRAVLAWRLSNGENFETTGNGFVDFLLLDEQGFPLIVLEAKAEDKNPLIGKEQARKYAKSQNCRFVILSNGNLHYWWDLEQGKPSYHHALSRGRCTACLTGRNWKTWSAVRLDGRRGGSMCSIAQPASFPIQSNRPACHPERLSGRPRI
jgi:hypothetical protein